MDEYGVRKHNGIFRLTNGGDRNKAGNRQPALLIGTDNKCSVYNWMENRNANERVPPKNQPLLSTGTWHDIQIKQSVVKGMWTLQFFVDGTEKEDSVKYNNIPPMYENIKAYAGYKERYQTVIPEAYVKEVKVWTGEFSLMVYLGPQWGFKIPLSRRFFAQITHRNRLKFMSMPSLLNYAGLRIDLLRNNAIFAFQCPLSHFETCLITPSRFPLWGGGALQVKVLTLAYR